MNSRDTERCGVHRVDQKRPRILVGVHLRAARRRVVIPDRSVPVDCRATWAAARALDRSVGAVPTCDEALVANGLTRFVWQARDLPIVRLIVCREQRRTGAQRQCQVACQIDAASAPHAARHGDYSGVWVAGMTAADRSIDSLCVGRSQRLGFAADSATRCDAAEPRLRCGRRCCRS